MRRRTDIFRLIAVLVGVLLFWAIFQMGCWRYFDRRGADGLNHCLVVVSDVSPFSCRPTEQGYDGFAYGVLRYFLAQYDKEVRVVFENDPQRQVQLLRRGQVDMIVRPSRVVALGEELAFVQPLYRSPLVMVAREGEVLTLESDDWDGVALTVPADRGLMMRLEHLADEVGGVMVVDEVRELNEAQVVQLVSEGEVKSTACSRLEARVYSAEYENLAVGRCLGFDQDYAWMVRRSDVVLCDELNTFLTTFVESREYRELFAEYFTNGLD